MNHTSQKDGVDLRNNSGITSSSAIKEICSPLYQFFKINYFNYVKIYQDGTRAILTDRPDFIQSYYLSPEMYNTKSVVSMENLAVPEVHFTEEFRNEQSYKMARNDFNIDHGFTIIQPTDSGLELYYFGTEQKNHKLASLYCSNIDVFYQFLIFFREKAYDLIKKAENDRFLLPYYANDDPINQNNLFNKNNINNFIESIKYEKVYLDINKNLFFTKRESQCIKLLLQAKTCKETARILKISHRTVEFYIESVKLKMSCSTKSDLIKKINEMNVSNIILSCNI